MPLLSIFTCGVAGMSAVGPSARFARDLTNKQAAEKPSGKTQPRKAASGDMHQPEDLTGHKRKRGAAQMPTAPPKQPPQMPTALPKQPPPADTQNQRAGQNQAPPRKQPSAQPTSYTGYGWPAGQVLTPMYLTHCVPLMVVPGLPWLPVTFTGPTWVPPPRGGGAAGGWTCSWSRARVIYCMHRLSC
jgi:hypothetical protein